MPPAPALTPSRIVGDLLASHPEAASLLAEASHRKVLAAHSIATAGQAFTAEQAARLRYQEMRHLLDPRRCRSVHRGVGLAILAALAAGAMGLLLAALYSLGSAPHRMAAWSQAGLGALTGVFAIALAAGTATLIRRLEPASVPASRRRWHRFAAEHAAAVRQARADSEAASIARTAWLGLVRSHATTVACGTNEQLVQDSVQLAAALTEPVWPRLP